ncbi:hypothetical protein BJF79_09570 [Actinomadura sp. CNU-125]|nr:hypothetical protein BJF79_09570 [Actinomadura sp. CNU-125]
MMRSSVHTSALGAFPDGSSTREATLTSMSCSRIARFSADRRGARIRCLVAAPTTRRPLTLARRVRS